MARFFVGQMVRVARPDDGSIKRGVSCGDQGVIACVGVNVDWNVEIMGKQNPFRDMNTFFPMFSDELEPIITSGHTPDELTVESLMPFLKTGEAVVGSNLRCQT